MTHDHGAKPYRYDGKTISLCKDTPNYQARTHILWHRHLAGRQDAQGFECTINNYY